MLDYHAMNKACARAACPSKKFAIVVEWETLSKFCSHSVRSGARYLVVGGVAVVLHGHPRFTADLDLVLSLDRDNVLLALDALKNLGYVPRAPVPVEDFADAELREGWIRDKGLTVFSLWSPRFPATSVDLFVREPFPFEQAYARALHAELGFATVTVVSVADLKDLKLAAGRAQDLDRMSDSNRDGWAEHEREQALAWARLSHADRLKWLSGAKRFNEIARVAAASRMLKVAESVPSGGDR